MLFLFFVMMALGGCGQSGSPGSMGMPSASGIPGMTGGSGSSSPVADLSAMIRQLTGSSQLGQQAQLQTTTLINSLNSLSVQLQNINLPQTGDQIFMQLNNVWAVLTGQPHSPPMTGRYPSVNVVNEQIVDLQSYLEGQVPLLKNMTSDQVNQYMQRLQQANTIIMQTLQIRDGYSPATPATSFVPTGMGSQMTSTAPVGSNGY